MSKNKIGMYSFHDFLFRLTKLINQCFRLSTQRLLFESIYVRIYVYTYIQHAYMCLCMCSICVNFFYRSFSFYSGRYGELEAAKNNQKIIQKYC